MRALLLQIHIGHTHWPSMATRDFRSPNLMPGQVLAHFHGITVKAVTWSGGIRGRFTPSLFYPLIRKHLEDKAWVPKARKREKSIEYNENTDFFRNFQIFLELRGETERIKLKRIKAPL